MKKLLAVLLTTTCFLSAQDHKLFSKPLVGVEGKAIPSGDPKSPDTTLGDIAVAALNAIQADDSKMTPVEKYTFYEMAKSLIKKVKADKDNFTLEELILIKNRIGQYPSTLMGPSWELLNPAIARVEAKESAKPAAEVAKPGGKP